MSLALPLTFTVDIAVDVAVVVAVIVVSYTIVRRFLFLHENENRPVSKESSDKTATGDPVGGPAASDVRRKRAGRNEGRREVGKGRGEERTEMGRFRSVGKTAVPVVVIDDVGVVCHIWRNSESSPWPQKMRWDQPTEHRL